MFQHRTNNSNLANALTTLELIFHAAVRSVRSSHANAFVALARNILQTALFVIVFYFMFSVLGLRGSAVRGDFLLFVMSGIFLFMCHTKAVAAIMAAEGPTSPMMKHAPMNTAISITASALACLYIQVLTMLIILFFYHVVMKPITIEDPAGAMGMVLLSWFTGCGVGLVFLAIRPWLPTFAGIGSTIYQRANMIASGKMFLANSLPAIMLPMFMWNPLFHCIDQARGFVFINYYPRVTSWEYAFWVGVVLFVIGLMGDFYTRKQVSLSWRARR